MSGTPRLAPLDPPYPEPVHGFLTALPLNLFRTFAHNVPMTVALQNWGEYLLDRKSNSLPSRIRELVISRVCGLCGCEYEWGVHARRYGDRVGLTHDQVTSTAIGTPEDPCWSDADRAVLHLVDELHATAHVSDETFASVKSVLNTEQLIEITMLAGWYHAISYVANTFQVTNEPDAPRFPKPIEPPL
jgi:alkylhydroperoxidase family enzyme